MVVLKDCKTKSAKTSCGSYTERNEEIGRPQTDGKTRLKRASM